MSLISYTHSQTSVILRVKILNSSVTTGAGLTGLTSASSGLIISTIADVEATATAYTAAGSTIETITTLGTYEAPTATKCRFKEVDSTNHPGVYEIHLADARLAVSNAKSLLVSISGASNAAETDVVIPLTQVDPYDNVRFGITALPNAAAGAAGGLPDDTDSNGRVRVVSGTGGGELSFSSGVVQADVQQVDGSAGSAVSFKAMVDDYGGDSALDVNVTSFASGIRPQLLVSTTIATLSTQTNFTISSGSTDDDAYNNAVIVVTDQSTATQKAVGTIQNYTGSTKTVELSADPGIFTMAVGDSVDILVATGSAPTAVQIRQEIDSNSTQLAAILLDTGTTIPGVLGTPAGADLAADIAAVKVDTADILLDTGTSGVLVSPTSVRSALGMAGADLDAQLDAILQYLDTDGVFLTAAGVDAIWNELTSGHVTAGSFAVAITDILTDTATTIPASLTAIETDTQDLQTQIGTAGAGLTDLGGMSTGMKAEVNAEVVDVISTDTHAEPGSVPAATSSLKDKLNWVFMVSRNKVTQTSTTQAIRDDGDTTDVATSTVSDDGTTFTRGEFS